MKAIKESNKDVAKLLINRDCDLSIADNKNRSALHWAAQLGRVDFVEDLIRGTDPLNSQILGYIDVSDECYQRRHGPYCVYNT